MDISKSMDLIGKLQCECTKGKTLEEFQKDNLVNQDIEEVKETRQSLNREALSYTGNCLYLHRQMPSLFRTSYQITCTPSLLLYMCMNTIILVYSMLILQIEHHLSYQRYSLWQDFLNQEAHQVWLSYSKSPISDIQNKNFQEET